MIKSSAYAHALIVLFVCFELTRFNVSVVYMLKRVGAFTVPCCSPSVILNSSGDVMPPVWILNFLFVSMTLMSMHNASGNFVVRNLYNKLFERVTVGHVSVYRFEVRRVK